MSTSTRKVDGRKEAIALLKRLKKINWERQCLGKSAREVRSASAAALTWPKLEGDAFFRVIGDWLETEVAGLGHILDDYEKATRR